MNSLLMLINSYNVSIKNNIFFSNKYFYLKSFNKNFKKLITNLELLHTSNIKLFLKDNLLFNDIIKAIEAKMKKNLIFVFCGFVYSKIFLKVGLGFRKKYSLSTSLYNLFIGRRKWVVFKIEPSSFFFNIRRRNIFFFCSSKNKLYEYLIKLKYIRKETVFKVKGIMSLNRIIFNRRISRSIIFARRVKFRKMKLKLTKKQSQKR